MTGTVTDINSLNFKSIFDLYKSKCSDNYIKYLKSSALIFIFQIKKRTIKNICQLNECGFGLESSEILYQIFKNDENFSRLNLENNNLLNEGAFNIAKILKENKNLIHLDLGGNNIKSEGLSSIFETLIFNNHLISLNFGSIAGNRNN